MDSRCIQVDTVPLRNSLLLDKGGDGSTRGCDWNVVRPFPFLGGKDEAPYRYAPSVARVLKAMDPRWDLKNEGYNGS